MIKSMTGYGWGESTGYDWNCKVELKAVNNRYLDMSVRLPPIMNAYSEQVRKVLSEKLRRGKIDVYINIESLAQYPVKISVNTSVTDAYMKAIDELLKRYVVSDQASLSLLALYPDAFIVDKSLTDETKGCIWVILERAVKEACKNLTDMRLAEGKALYEDIMAKRTNIVDMLSDLKARLPEVAADFEKRIRKRVQETLVLLPDAEPDESRLLTELALYIERSCIDEEIIRLESHITQLDKIVSESGSVGRKLDFLVQEMQREVNTIGSKTGDVVISRLVIDIKSEIEKIREQVQNVE